MSAGSGSGCPFPPRPGWALVLRSFRGADTVLGIKVAPSSDNDAFEMNDFALAAPEEDIQNEIQSTLDRAEDDDNYVDVVGCNMGLSVNRKKSTLKHTSSDGTEIIYSLYRAFLTIDDPPIPNWAMKWEEYVKKKESSEEKFAFTIIARNAKGEVITAVPKKVIREELKEAMKDRSASGLWKVIGDGLQVNLAACRIRYKNDKNNSWEYFRLGCKLTNRIIIDPYGENSKSELSGTEIHNVTVNRVKEKCLTFRQKQGGTNECIFVPTKFIPRDVLYHYAVKTMTIGEEVVECFGRIEKGRKPVICLEEGSIPVEIDEKEKKVMYDGENLDLSYGEFIWVYEDPPQASRTGLKTSFRAVPFSVTNCEILEKAKIRGEETALVDAEGVNEKGEKELFHFEVNLVNGKMYQIRQGHPFYFRRVWRIGTPFKSELINELWPIMHKFHDYCDVPSHWENKDPTAFRLVFLNEDSDEFKFVMSLIESSVNKSNEAGDPPQGMGGRSSKSSRSKAESKPKAVHVVCICRIEKPGRLKTYAIGKKEILNSRGSKISVQPGFSYLSAHPLATFDPKLEKKVNEQWLFNAYDPKFSQALLSGFDTNTRESRESNCFGSGTYFTDLFQKAVTYCACPICKGGKRRANCVSTGCICKELNSTHPRVVILSRVALGNTLVTRDIPDFRLHGDPSSYDPPKQSCDEYTRPIYVWYDESCDSEMDARKNIPMLTYNQDQYVFRYKNLAAASRESFMETPLNLFYIKNASLASPGYRHLRDCIISLPLNNSLERPTFAFVVDTEASDDAVKTAQELHGLLIPEEQELHKLPNPDKIVKEDLRRASEYMYMKKDTTLRQLLKKHEHDKDMTTLYREELVTVPNRDRKIEIPNQFSKVMKKDATLLKLLKEYRTNDGVFYYDDLMKLAGEVLQLNIHDIMSLSMVMYITPKDFILDEDNGSLSKMFAALPEVILRLQLKDIMKLIVNKDEKTVNQVLNEYKKDPAFDVLRSKLWPVPDELMKLDFKDLMYNIVDDYCTKARELLWKHRDNETVMRSLFDLLCTNLSDYVKLLAALHFRESMNNIFQADSVFVEDIIHSSPKMALDYPETAPSLVDVRQGKHREFVIFNQNRAYPEYAILFYQYKDEEEMRANISKEYPKNRHGQRIDEEHDPLYFNMRDRDIGSENDPKRPDLIPPPDKVSEEDPQTDEEPPEPAATAAADGVDGSNSSGSSSKPSPRKKYDGCFVFHS